MDPFLIVLDHSSTHRVIGIIKLFLNGCLLHVNRTLFSVGRRTAEGTALYCLLPFYSLRRELKEVLDVEWVLATTKTVKVVSDRRVRLPSGVAFSCTVHGDNLVFFL